MRRPIDLCNHGIPGLITLCMALLPVWDKATPVLLLLWALLLIASPCRSSTRAPLYVLIVLIAFCAFYMAHVLSLFTTNSYQEAYRELAGKSYLLTLPILIYFSRDVIRKHLNFMLFSYLSVCFAAAIFCIMYGLHQYMNAPSGMDGAWELLFYDEIALFMHPSYMAMHYMLAFSVSLYLANKQYMQPFIGKRSYSIAAAILGLYIFLLSSKACLIAVFILAIIFSTRIIVRHPSLKLKLYILSSILALGSILFFLNARFLWLYESLEDAEWRNIELRQGEDYSHVPSRILMWQVGLHIAQDNWMTGVGIGEEGKELNRVFDNYGLETLKKKNYNFHNQFLESTVILGIGGAVLLFFILFSAFRASLRPFSPLLVVVLVTIAINLLFESMLNRQAGILYFSFFISFFAFTNEKQQKPAG